ncbi:hypothetical protein ACM66B_006325 [Microbotryomycetes sp. NB124-2]
MTARAHPSLDETELRPANPEQYHQSLLNQFPQWGIGYSLEGFLERERQLSLTGMGRQMQCWVLVPQVDPETKEILCSCETFRRPILWSPRAGLVQDAVGYSIASVFTPPHNRRKGYALHMMKTLHSKLRLENEQTVPTIENGLTQRNDAVVSFLFSDVGQFYSQAGPPGWHTQGLSTTVWQVNSYPLQDSTTSSLSPVTADDFDRVAKADAELMRQDLATSKGSSYPAFATVLTKASLDWTTTRATQYAKENNLTVPEVWGFEIVAADSSSSSSSSLILFSYELKRKAIKVLRVRASSSNEFESLMDAVVQLARQHGVDKIVAWQVDPELLQGLPQDKRGETLERTDSLSALAEYAGDGEITWKANEAYAWC